jgi:type I restriction enzyme S subunit
LYGGTYPFIQTGDVKRALLYLREYEQTYSDAGLAQSKLWPAGTLCITIAANIAETAILDIDACFPDSVIGFTADPTRADTRFIKYLFDAVLKMRFRSFTQGAAQDNLSQEKLLSIKFPVPELSVQKRVADILSAHDDLIENNRKRIALLEEAARLLYREWFLHLRFPGHEHSALVDGLPANWSRLPIRDLADLYRGKSYSSAELVEVDGQQFVNLKCIDRNGGFRSSGLKRFRGESKPQHGVDPGDIVVAVTDMTRDALVVARAARIPRSVGSEAVFSMDLVKLKPKPIIDRAWLYGLLRYSSFPMEVREKATGATVLHLLPKHIEAWEALVPTPVLRNMFGEHHEALLAQIDSLELQNEKLAEARDLLLPPLMNGEIAV